MIMIRSIVRPENADNVLAALMEAGFPGITKMSVVGRGKQRGIKIGEITYDEIPKEMILAVVKGQDKDFVIKTIMGAARTGDKGAYGDNERGQVSGGRQKTCAISQPFKKGSKAPLSPATVNWRYRIMLLRHTPKEITERSALTINPAKTCQPIGAMYAALGIHGCLPHSHGSQGCYAYHRSALTHHFKEPAMAATSAFTEGATVFGGQANLLQAIDCVHESMRHHGLNVEADISNWLEYRYLNFIVKEI